MKAKTYFIISTLEELWPKDRSDLYIAERYVSHWLSCNQIKSKHNVIEVAPYRHQTKTDLITDSLFVDRKYNKYLDILHERLNTIHSKQYPREFWKKALSLAFIRHITLFHDLYMKCELYFDENIHFCRVLSESSFYIPDDYEDHRMRFQYSNLGQEQLLSIYMRLFYSPNIHYIESDLNTKSAIPRKDLSSEIIDFMRHCKSNLTAFYKQLHSLVFPRTKQIEDRATVGLLGVLFNKQDHVSLLKNKGITSIPNYAVEVDRNHSEMNKRGTLSRQEKDFDRFDQFFFEAIKYCMPRHLVEDYHLYEKKCLNVIDYFKCMRYVISETWISDSRISLMLALMQNHGIQHLHNEHNCFFHQCEGKYFEYVYDMSDKVLTLGWNDQDLPKLIPAASLFPFKGEKTKRKQKHDILYVSCPAVAYMPHYSSSYAINSENAQRTIDFTTDFFQALPDRTLNRITYRPYPQNQFTRSMTYNKEMLIEAELRKTRKLSTGRGSARSEMYRSRIVIVDYISTAYLESLISDIPTIFFWDPKAYYLKEKYRDFFLPLTTVGICQTDPVDAARFLEEVSLSPESWWMTNDVRNGRQEFLESNIGEKYLLHDLVTKLAEGNTIDNIS